MGEQYRFGNKLGTKVRLFYEIGKFIKKKCSNGLNLSLGLAVKKCEMTRIEFLIMFCCLLFSGIGVGTARAQSVSHNKSSKSSSQSATALDSTNFRLNIRGTVYENQTLQPMEGAAVKLYNGQDSMLVGNITQKNGQFLLPGVP